uniref:Tc1-like transposase DDE domain-containing protein n=1 Tax=Cyclopterus lumpus TaxID=8103 RepID=A0A8C3ANC3_CYCLU
MTTLAPTERGLSETLQNLGVEIMEWPVNNPDLNPIEHLWDQLRHSRVTNTTTVADLRQIMLGLVTSMRRRCKAVVVLGARVAEGEEEGKVYVGFSFSFCTL